MEPIFSFPVVFLISQDGAKIAFFKKSLKGSYHLIPMQDPQEALSNLSSTMVNVIILDGKLTGVPIMGLCRQIRSISGYRDVPILLISNNLKKTFVLEALNAGINDFINEPLDEREIYQRIAVAMKSQGAAQKKVAEVASRSKPSMESAGSDVFRNRLLLSDKALKEIAKAKKEPTSLNLLMIEIDAFQEIINKWGDLVGEEVFVALTSLLNQQLRRNDVLIPQGRGKFVLLLPKTEQRAALFIAETIRSKVSATVFNTRKKQLSLTVSIGLISYDKTIADKADPYENFDRMLTSVSGLLGKAQKKGNQIVFD